MKLLLDENLSRRLVPFLLETYPESSQVAVLGMQQASDLEVWRYAGEHGYVLVTHDADFYDLSLTRGAAPLVLWVRYGNADKSLILKLLLERRQQIEAAFATGITCVELRP
jgi:predicted nuclease of predicted toxin-antitoxin system